MDPSLQEEVQRLFRAGDLAGAEAASRAALRAEPRHAELLDLLGLILGQRGRHTEAVDAFTRAISAQPHSAVLHLHRGLALRRLPGRLEEAIAALRRAVALDPLLAEAHHQLGNALKRAGRLAEAVACLIEALRLAPQEATVGLNLGVALLELGRVGEAIGSFRRAVDLEPNRAEARNILGAALLDHGETSAGLAELREALRLKPDYAAAHNNVARALKAQGRVPDAIAEYRRALSLDPQPSTHSNLVYALNFDPGLSPEQIYAEHLRWAELHARPLEAGWKSPPNDLSPERRLRVGFVSPDLVNHAVAYFLEPLLAHHSRSSWQVFCYSDAAAPDRVTERLRGLAEQWRDTAPLADEQLDALIRRDRIDVLVDLAGHTARNRLLVFARRPAPVQVSWLGYPNTTGLAAIDYRITDAWCDPAGDADRWHAEELYRLPGGFLCYRPPPESPPAARITRSANEGASFASFSNFAKVSEPCLELWARVLRQVPRSTLWLKSRGLADPETIAQVQQRFRSFGVDPSRVKLDAKLLSVTEHLKLYQQVDVALDPFPYDGTTTTCEALWMGVPVVSLLGRSHVGRVGNSLLHRLGRPEWIAATPDDYVQRAAELAGRAMTTVDDRAALREQFQRSPICDAAMFAGEMDAALRSMWHRRCA